MASQREVALVSGASSGIGRAVAEELAARGYRVFAAARRLDRLEAMRGPNPEPLRLDVTDEASSGAAFARIEAEASRLDLLVNAAGYGVAGTDEEVAPEEARRQFDVNVFGPARVTRRALPPMRRQGSGRIVNRSSVAAKVATPVAGRSSASKRAVEALSDALRPELAPFGVRVMLVEPGAIKTGFDGVALGTLEETARLDAYRGVTEAFDRLPRGASERAPGPEIVAATVL